MNFKNSYEDIIEKTFKHIPATRRDRQKAIYDSCMGNDGLVPPIQVNISYFSTFVMPGSNVNRSLNLTNLFGSVQGTLVSALEKEKRLFK